MIRNSLYLALVTVLAASSCNKASAPEPSATEQGAHTEAHAEDKHAPAGAKPGSHDDWCNEHQVPESLCTRCNPSLIAAFKATGDWCEEHGLPESQCLICNPNLKIERPAKPTGVP